MSATSAASIESALQLQLVGCSDRQSAVRMAHYKGTIVAVKLVTSKGATFTRIDELEMTAVRLLLLLDYSTNAAWRSYVFGRFVLSFCRSASRTTRERVCVHKTKHKQVLDEGHMARVSRSFSNSSR